jgi:hypothetical protein
MAMALVYRRKTGCRRRGKTPGLSFLPLHRRLIVQAVQGVKKPAITYTASFTNLTFIPEILAASSFPPIAKMYLPKGTNLVNINELAITNANIHIGMGIPSKLPFPINRKALCTCETGFPPLKVNASPRAIVIIARVIMKGANLKYEINTPDKSPKNVATPIATIILTHHTCEFSFARLAAMTLPNATTAPTLKSIPPVSMTNVIPVAMIPFILICLNTFI